MREIKFRGKRVDDGEWVYGDLVKYYKNQRRFIACDHFAFTYTECGIDRLVSERFYEVIPETVGQLTGLHDKNGVEIWEGDIVLTDEAGWIGHVVYEHDCFMVIDNKGGFSSCCNWEAFEVIGNVHDNHEPKEG